MNSSTEHITINEVDIERFRELFRLEFNEEISTQEASDKARNLINLFKSVLQVETRLDNEKLNTNLGALKNQ